MASASAAATEAEHPAGSIVQSAAVSLIQSDEAHQSAAAAELKSRSQKLKEEIDRLKSSIPVRAIVRQQSKTKESTTTSHKEALRKQLRDNDAPLASPDCSITIAGYSQAQADQNNNNNNNNNISSASFDSGTTASSAGLSGYFECDELSDMVDDSLFEITNAGCLSRSVFPREDKMSTSRGRGATNQHEDDEDGERTPTNQERVISSDVNVAQQRRAGPEVVALNLVSSGGGQSHDIRITTISRARGTNSTSSSSHSSASSLVAQDLQHHNKRGDKITSERQPPKAGAESGRQNRKTATKDSSSRRAQISSGQPGGARKKIASAAATAASGSCCSDQTDDSPDRPSGREEKKIDAKRQRPAKKTARSQSNSVLAEGNAAAAVRQKAVNSRCPICCEQAAAASAQSNHDNSNQRQAKKPAGARKRRFTFSLFNLFTGGGGGSTTENGRDIDGDDEMSPSRGHHPAAAAATCQHHDLTPSARQDSIRVARTSASHLPGRRPGNGGARQFATKGRKLVGVAPDTPTNSNGALLPLRLRDSIRITNQRKARHQINQSNRLAARGAPARVSGHAPSSGNTTTGELLLDLSQTDGGPTPAATKSKCVKFTTPDRVLILSPTPTGDNNIGTTSSRRRPQPLRIPASASMTTGLASFSHSTGSPASIIKRSTTTTSIGGGGGVPKSSSYSQTEPNKGLDELLARYERDTSLVAEINEKLHLTETIASNRVALDSLGDDGAAKGGGDSAPSDHLQLDDVDEQLLEVARQQQRELAARTSGIGGPFDCIDSQQTRTASAHGEQREDFSQCDCGSNGGQAETAVGKRRTTDRREIKSGAGDDDDDDNAASGGITRADESKRTLSAPAATTSDRSMLISDLTRGAAPGKNMIGGAAPSDPNAENNQIYEPHKRQQQQPHRQRADTTSGRTQRARAFVAPDARHSNSLDQAAAVRHQRRASGNSQPQPQPPAEDERSGFSREWLGKQARAFV